MVDPLFLMVIREKDKAEGKYKEELREICEQFKPVYEKAVEKQKNAIDADLNEIKDYILSEETREEEGWENFILYFEEEAKLKKSIKDS